VPRPPRQLTHPTMSRHKAWPPPASKPFNVGGSTGDLEPFPILDISKWLQRKADGTPKGGPRVISQTSGRGHSVRTATIDGVPYVLHSEESVFGAAYGCIPQEATPFAGPAQPWLTNIKDPAHPVTVSQFGLEINEPRNCKRQYDAQENESVHYHDVDNAKDTTFVMASMWNAGIRLFDVRNPKRPAEVGYFNPGDIDPTASTQLDQAWAHVRWLPESGQIWFTTAYGGFWVVRMEGPLRDYLGLDEPNVAIGDSGRPGTVGAELSRPVYGYLDIGKYYCTVGAETAAVNFLHHRVG